MAGAAGMGKIPTDGARHLFAWYDYAVIWNQSVNLSSAVEDNGQIPGQCVDTDSCQGTERKGISQRNFSVSVFY